MTTVRIYHNVATDPQGRMLGIADGYQPAHPLILVDRYEVERDGPDDAILEAAFHAYNVGDDPHFGPPLERAVAYRKRRNRSLSVGDVVELDGTFYWVDRIGFARLDPGIIPVVLMTSGPVPGSTHAPPSNVGGTPVEEMGDPLEVNGELWVTLAPEGEDDRIWEFSITTGRTVRTV